MQHYLSFHSIGSPGFSNLTHKASRPVHCDIGVPVGIVLAAAAATAGDGAPYMVVLAGNVADVVAIVIQGACVGNATHW